MNLHLILTGRCNLTCRYCYQNARPRPERMPRNVATEAVLRVLALGDPPHRLVLSGGEPFLARDLVHTLIRLVREHANRWGQVECVVLSNGTLVSASDVDALAASDVELQLSFDGVPEAQSQRRPGTDRTLVRLIEGAFDRQTAWARRRLTIQMMLLGTTVSHLAQSVRSHAGRGVREVSIEPLATHDPSWDGGVRRQLEAQVEEILADGLEHYERTRRIPVTFLRRGGTRRGVHAGVPPSPFVCGAPWKGNVTVDPSGRAWACPSFVPSIQELPPLGREAAAALLVGDIWQPDLGQCLADLPRRAGLVPLLRLNEGRRSSRGLCSDCAVNAECSVCPASTCFIPGNRDPHRIPDNQCDFQQVTLEASRRFQGQIAAASFLGDMRRRTEALKRMVRA